MAGLIASMFGGKNRPKDDPLPGVGGYDMPRGPYGEGGLPGSTAAAPPTHPQSEEGSRKRSLTASGAQDQWKELPTRRVNGTPRQPFARDPRQATDTRRRSSPVISANVPGNENQRNTRYYGGRQAAPGTGRSFRSAPNPGRGKVQDVFVSSDRYVYGGVNGGYEGYEVQRQMPYRIHARPEGYEGAPSNRGADLSGQRFTMPAKNNLNSGGQGAYGIGRQRGPLHRPVRFRQPGPWTANYYDVAPDEGSQAPNMIHESASRRNPGKPKGKTSPDTRHDTETRRLTSRSRTPRSVSRG